jgi:hypothetical protein
MYFFGMKAEHHLKGMKSAGFSLEVFVRASLSIQILSCNALAIWALSMRMTLSSAMPNFRARETDI